MLKWFVSLLLFLPLWSVSHAAEPNGFPLPVGVDVSNRFVGTVHRNDLIQTDAVYKLPQTNVISFAAGSHSGWHTHGAMTVIGIAGTGLYQEWGERTGFDSSRRRGANSGGRHSFPRRDKK